ncbi:glycosyltransferase family 4 protein [Salinibacter ruber]|uniref:Glycosyltransferase involved in cell wall biosynthesis n=1 Tax=Salinibacter ruber TaxID=146919 RepID=A0A9X2Q0F6_9BACT|nr:glycosyltransferase family 4 protein [Salinibacter ruber]MCS3678762.1 glycosyltransferase involved in cell wall biosynthesis [Salinibacter ruber]
MERLYTDVWCSRGREVLKKLPEPVRSFANRFHPALPDEKVVDFKGWAVRRRIARWLRGTESDKGRYRHYLNVGEGFARRVRSHLFKSEESSDGSVFFGYDTGSLEILEALKESECITLLDQMDPGRVEKNIVLEEIERWPGWAESAPVLHSPYEDRRRREWEAASAVIVNSEWSKEALVQQGVPEEKTHVLPLAYEASADGKQGREKPRDGVISDSPLHVLWLGTVGVRKGIQYLVDAAHRLSDAPIRFSVVGPIHITDQAVASAPSSMTFEGPMPRDKVSEWYRQADVFVLPTLSDGFAITQLEAMAHGLPVVTTPNCGRVVTDGKDGRVIPPRDVDALAEALIYLEENREEAAKMGRKARKTSKQYTLDRVGTRLEEIVSNVET